MIPVEFRGDLWLQKTRVPALSCGVVCVILRSAVLVELGLVTDTDRDIDRETQTQGCICRGRGLGVEPPAKISDPPAAIKKRKGGRLFMYLCISTVVDFNSQNFDPPNEI